MASVSQPRRPRAEDHPTQRLSALMRAAAEARLEMARRMGMGVNEVAALEYLLTDGPLGPVELGERLGMRSASATGLVDRLEAAGHVERLAHPSDRRRRAVVPTEHALRTAMAAFSPLTAAFDAAAADLDDDERAVVSAYLARVTEAAHGFGTPRR